MNDEDASEEYRVRTRRFRRWYGVVGVLGLLVYVALSILPSVRQAQQDARRRAARSLLGRLHPAEMRYHAAHGSFARLDTLHAAGDSPVGEGQVRDGYRFTSVAGRDDFTITARCEGPGGKSYRIDASGQLDRPIPKPASGPSPQEKIAAAKAKVAHEPGSAPAWLELTRALFAQRRLGEALVAARHAAQLDPKAGGPALRGVLIERGDELSRGGSPRAALPLLQEALAMDAADPEGQALLGDAYRLMRRPDAAIKAYNKALALRDVTVGAWYGLAKIHEARGEKEEAMHAYLRVISVSEDALIPQDLQRDAWAGIERLRANGASSRPR